MGSAASGGGSRWIRGVLALLLGTGLLSLALEASSLDYAPHLRRFSRSALSLSVSRPRAVAASAASLQELAASAVDALDDWAARGDDDEGDVPPEELYQLSLLHDACMKHRDEVLTWQFGAPAARKTANNATEDDSQQFNETRNEATLIAKDDPELLEKLRVCPDVDLFLPADVRNNGYCEDASVYTKFLRSRILPRWVLDVKMYDPTVGKEVDYFDLCPTTPVVFFNHYWDNDVPNMPRWPKETKPVWLMPNIEMWELKEDHFWRVNAVLCKTKVCYERVTKWYEQEGNPRNTTVFYTKHTSSDQAAFARKLLADSSSVGDDDIKPKDFENVKFLHTVGGSYWKGTLQVLECWLSRSDFPPLDLYIHKWAYDGMFHGRYNDRIAKASNIRLTTDEVDQLTFGKTVAEASFFLCPSITEGYGHYMNQARASGGVIVTTDLAPMNELVTDEMGVKVKARAISDSKQFLGGKSRNKYALKGVPGMVAQLSGRSLCSTIDKLLKETTVEQRKQMAEAGRRQYHRDTKFFARSMRELRAFARGDSVAPVVIDDDGGDNGQDTTPMSIQTSQTVDPEPVETTKESEPSGTRQTYLRVGKFGR